LWALLRLSLLNWMTHHGALVRGSKVGSEALEPIVFIYKANGWLQSIKILLLFSVRSEPLQKLSTYLRLEIVTVYMFLFANERLA
jgi:hypothetical protein